MRDDSYHHQNKQSKGPTSRAIRGADEQIRTADLLITNQLLYQLSYVGTSEQVVDSSAAP